MKLSIFAAALILLCSSCAVVYYPSSRNAPMFSGKGEIQGSVSTGTGNNLQMAYALTNHIGVMANGMLWTDKEKERGHLNSHRSVEAAFGYYLNMKENLYVDAWGGYGWGNVKATDSIYYFSIFSDYPTPPSSKSLEGNYQKIFFQASTGFKTESGNLRFGLVHRFSLLDFSTVRGHDGGTPVNFTSTLRCFYEPSLVVKFFYRQFFVSGQGGVNVPMGGSINENINYKKLQLSVGLGVRLNLKKENK